MWSTSSPTSEDPTAYLIEIVGVHTFPYSFVTKGTFLSSPFPVLYHRRESGTISFYIKIKMWVSPFLPSSAVPCQRLQQFLLRQWKYGLHWWTPTKPKQSRPCELSLERFSWMDLGILMHDLGLTLESCGATN